MSMAKSLLGESVFLFFVVSITFKEEVVAAGATARGPARQ
jgi:hypothetical protein